MSIWQIFKVSRKTFFDPSAWFAWPFFKSSNELMYSVIRDVTTSETAEREESFTQALKRLDLTEKEVEQTQRRYFLYAMIFAVLGLATLIFSFYLLFYHTVHGFLIGLAATAIFIAQAFRYHFWYFQIKHRKLGCTFNEWLRGKTIEEEKGK